MSFPTDILQSLSKLSSLEVRGPFRVNGEQIDCSCSGAEQKVKEPRSSIFVSIYVFMAFSLLMSSAGFFSEYSRSQEIKELTISWDVLDALINDKGGKISQLRILDRSDPSYVDRVNIIREDLEIIDDNLRKAMEK